MESGRMKALMQRLDIDVAVCDMNADNEVECLNKVTDLMDSKLKQMRSLIEKQKRHHAFRTYSYPELDEALNELGY